MERKKMTAATKVIDRKMMVPVVSCLKELFEWMADDRRGVPPEDELKIP
jgi:hypothetical protein